MSKAEVIKAFSDWVDTLPEERLEKVLKLIKEESGKSLDIDMELVKKILAEDKNLMDRLAQ